MPYLYSDAEVGALMSATTSLRPALHAATYRTLIGLLAVTGMRLGEVIRLDRSDLDTAEAIVTIRDSKFGKSRQVPLHPSTLDALADYARVRDQRCPEPSAPSLLISTAGTRLIRQNVEYVFARLVRPAGLRARSDACRPRLHDFRHSLAVHTLLGWYRDGLDVQARLPLLSTLLGHTKPAHTYWYLSAVPELLALAAERRDRSTRRPAHEPASPRPWRRSSPSGWSTNATPASIPSPPTATPGGWLLRYAQNRTGKQPCQLDLTDLDATFIGGFLDHLEQERGNSVRTRNARLAAIRSFFRYAALRHPEHAQLIARVLAIPTKRGDRTELAYLDQPEVDALLAAPDRRTWTGRRDHALLDIAVDTGLRVSELTGLRNSDVVLGTGAHLNCTGKGRKRRCTPLRKQTAAVLGVWMKEREGAPDDPLFPTRRGSRIGCGAVQRLVTKHARTAAQRCPSLNNKHTTPHILRHTCAMSLLAQGVDTTVIALWLGHERVETTQIYVHADMSIKERALARTTPPGTAPGRYRPPDALLAFLDGL